MRKVELSELQDLVYDIFVEFDRICRKHGIKYSMEGGTLLGAVKYQNFVPWDDDIDVIMLREEYERFLTVAPIELKECYSVQSYNNIKEFPLNFAKLCFNDAKIYDYEYSHIKSMNHGIFIDIFPIDNVKPSSFKKHCSMSGVLTGGRKAKLSFSLAGFPTAKKIIYKTLALLPIEMLIYLHRKVCTKYDKKKTGYRYEICNPNRNFKPLKAELYDELVELPFRDKKFYAVKEYDEFLRSRFGQNYMNELPDQEKRKPSHCSNIFIS